MPPAANTKRKIGVHVRIESGLRLVSLDVLLAQIAPMGLTMTGLRMLLDNLQVPTIEIGRTRLVDLFSFQLALRAVLRVGEPDFLTPGCHTIKRRNTKQRPPLRPDTTLLDPVRFHANWKRIVSELIAARRSAGRLRVHRTTTLIEQAADRLLAASVHLRPLEAQVLSDRAALQSANARQIFHEAPP